MTDKELRENLSELESKDNSDNKSMKGLRERVLAAAVPAKFSAFNDKFNCRINKRMSNSRNAVNKRARVEGVQSTPNHNETTPRPSLGSLSSIESLHDNSQGLQSVPSDSSDLVALNGAIDASAKLDTGVLSNSSDFEVLINATCEAEMNNHRESKLIKSSSSDSSSSSISFPRIVLAQKRKGDAISSPAKVLKNDSSVESLCSALEEKSLIENEEKSFNSQVKNSSFSSLAPNAKFASLVSTQRRPDLKPHISNQSYVQSEKLSSFASAQRRPGLRSHNSNPTKADNEILCSLAPSSRRPGLKPNISNHSKVAKKMLSSAAPSNRRPDLKPQKSNHIIKCHMWETQKLLQE